MSRLRIGLDLDGVCYQWESTARYMVRQRMLARGETPPPELYRRFQHWDWLKEYSTPDDWKWLWNEGITEGGVYRYGHVVEGAIDGVRELTSIADVTIVTSRPKIAVHDTMAWLGLMFDKCPLAGVAIQSDGQKKSEVKPCPDIFIDDAKHNFDDMLDNTESAIIQYWQPWNADYKIRRPLHSSRLFPANDWRDVVQQVKRLNDVGWRALTKRPSIP